jgi:hypothetical protein
MYSNALPVIVDRHLPLLPMGLVSPAFSWASVDDDLNYIFHIASGRGTVITQSGVMRFSAPCAVIVPAGEAHNFQFDLNASGMALTISAAYLENLLHREKDFTILFAAPVIVPLVSEQLTWPLARLAHELSGSDVARTAAADSHLLSILVQCVRALEHSRAIQSAHPKAATTLVTRLREPDPAPGSLPDGHRHVAQSVDSTAHSAGGAAGAAQLHHDHRPDRLLSGFQRSGLFLALFHQGDGAVAAHVPRKAEKQLAVSRAAQPNPSTPQTCSTERQIRGATPEFKDAARPWPCRKSDLPR